MSVPAHVIDHVRDIEARAEIWADHFHISRLFTDAANSLADDDERKQFVLWEIWLHDYTLSPQKPDTLQPMMVMDGQRYPVSVETFPEGGVAYFRTRLESAKHPSVRARLADFLWLRTKDIRFADAAIAAYLDAAPALLASTRGSSMASDHLARASYLVLSLKRDPQTLLVTLRPIAEKFLNDEDGNIAHLVEATTRVIDKDAVLSQWLIDAGIALVKRKGTPPNQNRLLERRVLEVLLGLAAVRKNQTLANELRLQIAVSHEDEAREREAEGGLIQAALLSDAIKAYQELGRGDDVDRLKPRLHQANQEATKTMHRFSTKVEIPIEQFQKRVDAYLAEGKKYSPIAHLHLFALHEGFWPEWADVAKETAELARQFPLQALATKVTITADGRPHERPGDPEQRRQFDEIERYVENLEIQMAFSTRKVALLRERDAWNEQLLMQALGGGMLFDDEVLKAVQPGIRAFEEARYWEALHALVPQIERIIRKLARGLGAEVFRYKPDTGELHWTSLKTLLTEPRVVEVLAIVSPDFARELGHLFIDSRGLNLRDDVAHGIISPDIDSHRLALLCVVTLLTISTLVQREAGSTTEAGAPETVTDAPAPDVPEQ
jgi:uncharacterized protein DUF4209